MTTHIPTPFAYADGYKLSHWTQYPEGTEMVYSNFTPRKSRNGQGKFVFFGLQAFLIKMTRVFNDTFFDTSKEYATAAFAKFYADYFGTPPSTNLVEKIGALWELQYLPLEFRALPEGSVVNHGIPCFTVHNTRPEFYWLTNFIETWLSSELWHTCTSATTAFYYRRAFDRYARLTSDAEGMVPYQGHDFSFRGLPGAEAAAASGAAHLLFFDGTDNCVAPYWIKENYGKFEFRTSWTDPDKPWFRRDSQAPFYGTSVPATEHSVMCSDGVEGEFEMYERLITEVYPEGIVSIVSDTFDFWRVVTEYLPKLKDKIMARNGKVVIRPDSSPKTPVEIICGDPDAPEGTPENLGLARCLYNIFGGTVNTKGYIDLHPSIGMIYGDSITLETQEAILKGLWELGFASTNIVLGIGSFTYQHVTRDTHGIAIKATAIKVNGEYRSVFKDPKTDNSGKKSAKGLLAVVFNTARREYELQEDVSYKDWEEALYTCLKPVYRNGHFLNPVTFEEVRNVAASF